MKGIEEQKPIDPNWPKWKYHSNGKAKIVASKREEDFLGEAWKDSPAEHGIVTHPHSDEYLAMNQMEAVSEEGLEEKPKGRKPKG